MAQVPEGDAPVSIPGLVPIVLWAALPLLLALLVVRRRHGGWPCTPVFGWALIPACAFADAATVLAAARMETHAETPFVATLLWIAMACSLTTFFALRGGDQGPDEDGGDEDGPYPEPPWWPDFERDLREYMRRPRPRIPAGTR